MNDCKDISDWQQQVSTWMDKTLPNATEESIIARLRHDVDSLTRPDWEASELADVVLSVLHLASKRGVSLEREVHRKHCINVEREWIPHPNEANFYPHRMKGPFTWSCPVCETEYSLRENPDKLCFVCHFRDLDVAVEKNLWTCPRCKKVYSSERTTHPGFCNTCLMKG